MLARSRTLLVLSTVALALAACGPSRDKRVWNESMKSYYSNTSVRPAEPPRTQWEHQDEDLLQRRLGYADVVVVGTAEAVNLYANFNTPKQIGVTFKPKRILYGSLEGLTDEQGNLYLQLDPGDEDFQMALRTFKHLPGSRYLLLLKHPPEKDGRKQRPKLHWATYNPDDKLLSEIEAMFRWLEKKKKN
jgi:hypothetical protein